MFSPWTRRSRIASRPAEAPAARRRAALRRRPLVEIMEGRQLLSTLTVSTTADNGNNASPTAGSLRQAIIQADAQPAGTLTTINFKVGSGPIAFHPPTALPAITRPIVLDATTQPGYAGKPIVDLDGTNAGPAATGLVIQAPASGTAAAPSAVKGLEITGFGSGGVNVQASYWNFTGDYVGLTVVGNFITAQPNGGYGLYFLKGANYDRVTGSTVSGTRNGSGVVAEGASYDTFSGDFIGTDPAGRFSVDEYGTSLGNADAGVLIYGGANHITVTNSVLSNNGWDGVWITDAGTSDNSLTGDFIGTDAAGGYALPNHIHGVEINGHASYNTVGGTTAAAADVISGNSYNGVAFSGDSNNQVLGDFIGTDKTGSLAVPNGANGVFFSGSTSDTVGGTTSHDVISGNANYGVWITGASTKIHVLGDFIGTDKTGTKSVPNLSGVWVDAGSTSNTIGGTATGARDLISGNAQWGVYIGGSGTNHNLVEGDYIGTDATGTKALPNGYNGLDIVYGAVGNTVGGTTAGARNVISGNAFEGVLLGFAGTTTNLVEGNDIGTDYTGTKAVPNGQDGVQIIGGASGNTIGGATAGARNVISGNADHGILITDQGTSANVVQGDYIGTDVTGKVAVPNHIGVTIAYGATNNTLGGMTASARDVISGNGWDGVELIGSGTMGDVVDGDYIGVDVSGLSLGNGGSGVAIMSGASFNTVGSNSLTYRDIISGNTYDGVYISDSGTNYNTVSYAFIGLDPTGELARGNGRNGVTVQAGAQGNNVFNAVISANVNDGVLVDGSTTTATSINYDWIGVDAAGTKAVFQTGHAYSNYWGVLFADGANDDSASSDVISGNYIGVQLSTGAAGNFINNDEIGTAVNGTGNVGNVVDGIELVGVVGNDMENDLIVYNGNVGIQGVYGSNDQNNSINTNDRFTVTVNGVVYGNKNGPTDFD